MKSNTMHHLALSTAREAIPSSLSLPVTSSKPDGICDGGATTTQHCIGQTRFRKIELIDNDYMDHRLFAYCI